MKSAFLAAFAFVALLLPVIASAAPRPALYYLHDGAAGPVGDGILNLTAPHGAQPSVRPVPVAVTQVAPVQFLTNASKHPNRIAGPVYLALWTGPAATLHGNLTATFFVMNGTQRQAIANASLVLDANASKLPAPTSLVPPSPTGDPQQTVLYELLQILPAVTPPAQLLYLGFVDVRVNETARIGVDFSITAGSSAIDAPTGAAGSIQYNSTLNPSFLYVPWYAPSPVATYPPRTATATLPNRAGGSGGANDGIASEPAGHPESGGGGLPAPAATIGLAAVAAVFLVLRRRAA